jgi:hypothetical protein
VSRELGLVRTLDDASGFAATGWSYLSTPARAHVWWSAQFSEGGNVLFPGALGLLLTAVAIARGDALRDRRARMCLAVGIAGVALSFGANLPGYSVLYAVMPLLHGIRATARFGVLATCAVAVLSGFGVVALRRAVPARAWSPLAVVLVLLASFESLAAPLGSRASKQYRPFTRTCRGRPTPSSWRFPSTTRGTRNSTRSTCCTRRATGIGW